MSTRGDTGPEAQRARSVSFGGKRLVTLAHRGPWPSASIAAVLAGLTLTMVIASSPAPAANRLTAANPPASAESPISAEPSTGLYTAADGAQLLWSDEFDGPAGAEVNPANWSQQVGAPTNGGRVEYDTPGTHNVALDGQGDLAITARRENAGGRAYTSGRIESTHSITTGYVEFRAKLTTWSGSAPSLWTYGAAGYGPASSFSEVDLVETTTWPDQGPAYARQTIHASFPADNAESHLWTLGWSQNAPSTEPAKVGAAWHTFGVYIDPVAPHDVTFYFDQKPYGHYTASQLVYDDAAQEMTSPGNWPFGTYAQKLIVEVEMGLYTGGQISPDQASDTMLVDYARMYDRPPH